ncbi:MAG: glycosyltransferase [Campylobacterota bacterium]|nr:glycosyltransferase [Campylobacterota bacterium]
MLNQYKLAFILPPLDDTGGVIPAMMAVIEYLKPKEYQVDIYAIGKTKLSSEEKIFIINTDNKKLQYKYFIDCFTNDYDLVVANNLRTHRICIENDVKNLLCHFHQGNLLRDQHFISFLLKRYKMQYVYKNRYISFVSQCLMQNVMKKFDINTKHRDVIYNALDKESLNKKANDTIEENLPQEYIIGVGRFTKLKRFDRLIHIFSKLSSNEHLVLLGDGEEKSNLEKLVDKLGLQDRVHFLGWKKNPYPYMKNAKLFVSTSSSESFSMVLAESFSLKVPSVSYDIKCGPNEIMVGELKDYLVEDNNEDKLLEKIQLALKYYPDIKDEYLEKFSVHKIANKFLNVLEYYVNKKDLIKN